MVARGVGVTAAAGTAGVAIVTATRPVVGGGPAAKGAAAGVATSICCNDAKNGVSSKRMRELRMWGSRGWGTPASVTQALYIRPVSVSLQHGTRNGERLHTERHTNKAPHTF